MAHTNTPNEALLRRMAAKIRTAEQALGTLTAGQKRDLLLDNFACIADSEHAGLTLAAIERMLR